MTVFFTSDTHFGHRNIIEYSDRPFCRAEVDGSRSPLVRPSEVECGFVPDVQAMDEELIRRWNEVVSKDDFVFHLGDFVMGPDKERRLKEVTSRLNGSISLVKGNHDLPRVINACIGRFTCVSDHIESLSGMPIALRHAPFEFGEFGPGPFPFYGKANILLCGHVHEAWKVKRYSEHAGVMINVGVDQWDYRPVPLADLLNAAGETLSL